MAFHKAIRAYCFIPNPLVSSAPESRLYIHAYSSFVTSHKGALTFTGHWPQTYCVVSGAYVPKVVLELERTAYVLDCESSRKEQSPALVYAIEGTRT